jgi:hypothetical protein
MPCAAEPRPMMPITTAIPERQIGGGCDVSQGEAFILPLEDREQHDGRADIREMRMNSQNAPKRTCVSLPSGVDGRQGWPLSHRSIDGAHLRARFGSSPPAELGQPVRVRASTPAQVRRVSVSCPGRR